MKKNIHIWVGVLFALLCLYLAFRGISFREMWESFKQAAPLPILVAVAIYSIDFAIRAKRWSVLMSPVREAGAADLFWVMMIGFFANNILPLRMGELVRAHACGNKLGVSRTACLGTIFLERLCDTVSFLTTFLVASLFLPFPPYMKKGAWLLGGACLAAVVALLLIHHREEAFRGILERAPMPKHWKTRLHDLATHFIQSTSGIRQLSYVFVVMAFSLGIWVLEGTFLYLVANAFRVPLAYASAFFLLFALGLSVTLPQAPGYVGTFELFGVTALALLGIPKTQGLPVILAVHGLQFAFISITGGLALWKEGLNFRALTSSD